MVGGPHYSAMNETDAGAAGKRADDRSALTRGAHVLGKKWYPVIVHRLLESGPLGFNRLQDRVDGISSTVLSDSLEDLQDNGIVDRTVICESPYRVEYALTERGRDLEPVVAAMAAWSERHLVSRSRG